jgi:hypothetical protein
VSRCKYWTVIFAVLIIATALAAVVVPQKADAATTKSRLSSAKHALNVSRDRLKSAEAALAAAEATQAGLGTSTTDPSATPTPLATPAATPAPALTVDELRARVLKARKAVRVWKRRVGSLARQYRLERNMVRWERKRQWMKIIQVAAAKYHVKADGMYRMMMRESGGQQYAGSSTSFKGLFQYYTGTWSSSWNPWRGDNIYDGSSQIFATAYAIHKGMGAQMWTTTYASQY